jgi:hypothetical protein
MHLQPQLEALRGDAVRHPGHLLERPQPPPDQQAAATNSSSANGLVI